MSILNVDNTNKQESLLAWGAKHDKINLGRDIAYAA